MMESNGNNELKLQENTDSSNKADNENEKIEESELGPFFIIDKDDKTVAEQPQAIGWSFNDIIWYSSKALSLGAEIVKIIYNALPSREQIQPFIPAVSVSVTFPGLQPPGSSNDEENIIPQVQEMDNKAEEVSKNVPVNVENKAEEVSKDAPVKIENNKVENFNPHFKIAYSELKGIKEISRGTQGVVYLVKWRNTEVAVKHMLFCRATQQAHDLFLQEIQIMARLRHPNILQFMGVVDEPTKGLAIVMEYMPEGTLSGLLGNKKVEITWENVCRLSLGIAKAIAFLHPTTLHRDIKSPNIFVTRDWSTKLGDFGLSVVLTGSKIGDNEWRAGTPLWMAPELLKGEKCTTASDVFSVGVVYNQIASRQEPHHDIKTLKALYKKLVVDDKRDNIPEETPETYKNLILHCWDAVAEKRPKAESIVLSLEKFEQELQEQKQTNKKITCE